MSNYKFETLQLHVGQEQADPATDSRAVPIYQTTSYVFRNSQHAADRFGLADAGNIYGRLTNSTQDVFEKRIAALEGGVAALATASGAAAITYTIEALAQAGDHRSRPKRPSAAATSSRAPPPQFGATPPFCNRPGSGGGGGAPHPPPQAVYLETLGNPNSDIPDIDAIAAIAHKHGLPLVIDNTFGTPYLIRPIEHGADIVVHSATKFIGGHGTTLGGIIVDSGKFDWKASGKFGNIADPNPSYHGVSFADAAGPAAFVTYIRAILLRDTGATISPFNAFLLRGAGRRSQPAARGGGGRARRGGGVVETPPPGGGEPPPPPPVPPAPPPPEGASLNGGGPILPPPHHQGGRGGGFQVYR